MTLLSSLRSARMSVENPAVPLTSTSLLDWIGGAKTSAGVAVSESSSLGLPAVFRAVNVIAGTSASLPLHPYRTVGNAKIRVTSGRPAQLLDSPHPDMTPFELWEVAYTHLALWGNAYLRIVGSVDMPVKHLWPIHPGRVRVGRESETGRKIYAVDGGKEVHSDDTILHIPGFGYDGICGVSPIRAARQGLGLALAAEEYGAKLFGSGSLASGILQTEQRLTQPQADALATRWRAKRTGLGSAHDTIILDRGAKFQQLTIPPEDAQFLQTRRFQVSEVARMFGVPPHMLMDTEKSTSWGTGIEQQAIGFVVYTLRPWLTRVEQRMTQLLRPQAVYARYSVEGLLRGDSKARAEFYDVMTRIGAFSINEVRELEERAPIDGGDAHYRQLNLGEVGAPDPSTATEEEPANA